MAIVIGISCFYHDSAVAVVDNGRIVFAAHEERYTRIKGDSSFPHLALSAALTQLQLKLAEVDSFVFYEKPYLKLSRIVESLYYAAPVGLKQFEFAIQELSSGKLDIRNLLSKEIFKTVNGNLVPEAPFSVKSIDKFAKAEIAKKIFFSSHHDSHAASAYFCSSYESAHILVLDAVGEEETGSFFKAEGSVLNKLEAVHYPHSYGMLYSAVTHHLGFKVNSGEYKVMGLAPYGRPVFVDQLREELLSGSGENFALKIEQFGYLDSLVITGPNFLKKIGLPPRSPNEKLTQSHCNLAASIQKLLEEEVMALCKQFLYRYDVENLCLAGGVALNCVNNSNLARELNIKNIFVQPASGDAGGSLGAALYFSAHAGENSFIYEAFSPYLGSSYPDAEEVVIKCASAKGLPYKILDDAEFDSEVAKKLADKNIIGWFQGRSEFGPRSLGHRSILALPTNPETQFEINLKIKFRESFRPFAPICLEEYARDIFDICGDSRFMLFVADTIGATKIKEIEFERLEQNLKVTHPVYPAITHVDGTARLQTINSEQNAKLHAVMTRLYQDIGVPLLVNTSFNVRGEPIVETPEDAMDCFIGTNLDCLICGNVMIEKPLDFKAAIHAELFELD